MLARKFCNETNSLLIFLCCASPCITSCANNRKQISRFSPATKMFLYVVAIWVPYLFPLTLSISLSLSILLHCHSFNIKYCGNYQTLKMFHLNDLSVFSVCVRSQFGGEVVAAVTMRSMFFPLVIRFSQYLVFTPLYCCRRLACCVHLERARFSYQPTIIITWKCSVYTGKNCLPSNKSQQARIQKAMRFCGERKRIWRNI